MVKHNQNLLVSESSEQNEKGSILNLLDIEKDNLVISQP